MWTFIFAIIIVFGLGGSKNIITVMVYSTILVLWIVFPFTMVVWDINTNVVESKITQIDKIYHTKNDGYFYMTKQMDKIKIIDYEFKKYGKNIRLTKRRKQKNKIVDKLVFDYYDYKYYIIQKDVIYIQ